MGHGFVDRQARMRGPRPRGVSLGCSEGERTPLHASERARDGLLVTRWGGCEAVHGRPRETGTTPSTHECLAQATQSTQSWLDLNLNLEVKISAQHAEHAPRQQTRAAAETCHVQAYRPFPGTRALCETRPSDRSIRAHAVGGSACVVCGTGGRRACRRRGMCTLLCFLGLCAVESHGRRCSSTWTSACH